MEYTYTKILVIVSLKFKFNWVICVYRCFVLFCFLNLKTLGQMDGKSHGNLEFKTWGQCLDSPPRCEVKLLTSPLGSSVSFSMKWGWDPPQLPCRLIWDSNNNNTTLAANTWSLLHARYHSKSFTGWILSIFTTFWGIYYYYSHLKFYYDIF